MTEAKSPLVLFHGATSSGLAAWRDTLPQLAAHHEVLTPTALGHRGGSVARRRPATIWDVIDDAEAYLDQQGLQQPHLAGHSMGGFVALELARRGRAATVCALSPGGFWSPGDGLREQVAAGLRRNSAMVGVLRPAMKLAFRSATIRRSMMRDAARHADQQVAPMDPLPCPVTVAWSENDAMLPLAICEKVVRQRLPAARFVVLPDVGHVPMIDDPQLASRTILAITTSSADHG